MTDRCLLLVFTSIRPGRHSRLQLRSRENQYSTALRQLSRVLPLEGWDVVLCDNTGSSSFLVRHGKELPLTSVSGIVQVEENSGSRNKGVGELDMLAAALDGRAIEDYRSVSYFTGRHLLPNSYLFERTERMNTDALISNPDFLYLDGEFHEVEKRRMFNDMFFSMRTNVILGYVDYFLKMRVDMISKGIGSEQLLYKFIESSELSVEILPHLGILRREIRGSWLLRRDRWHIC